MMPLNRLAARLAKLEAENVNADGLREVLGEAAFQYFWSDPQPAWIKGVRPCPYGGFCTAMLAINPAYSARFRVPLRTYLNQPDTAAWEVDNNFADLDQRVYETGEWASGYERGPILGGQELGGNVIKFPLKDSEGNVYAVAGRALDWRGHNPIWQRLCELNQPKDYQGPDPRKIDHGLAQSLHLI